MRSLALSVIVAVIYSLSGCGDDTSSDTADAPTTSTAPVIEAPSQSPAPGVSQAPKPTDDGVESTQENAETFAVTLEQVFFSSGYPRDLAGAKAAAKKAGLKLSAGNSIGSYTYDPDDVEFRLCVENVSGAFATYDTRPMSMREAGDQGGCPTS